MIRNLKALGLALVAVFALGAVVASSASAQTGKITSTGPVTLTGEDTGVKTNFITAFGEKIECPDSTYTGHKFAATPHQLLPVNSTEVTVTPHYRQTKTTTANCDVLPAGGGALSATVTMNGCDYRLSHFTTAVTASHPQHTYTFTTEVFCPPNQVVAVHIYFSHTHTAANECLTITIPGQPGLPGGTATTTTASDDIDLTGTVNGIKVIRHSKSFLCPGNAEENNAKFDFDVTVKGHNAAKENTGVTITH